TAARAPSPSRRAARRSTGPCASCTARPAARASPGAGACAARTSRRPSAAPSSGVRPAARPSRDLLHRGTPLDRVGELPLEQTVLVDVVVDLARLEQLVV